MHKVQLIEYNSIDERAKKGMCSGLNILWQPKIYESTDIPVNQANIKEKITFMKIRIDRLFEPVIFNINPESNDKNRIL